MRLTIKWKLRLIHNDSNKAKKLNFDYASIEFPLNFERRQQQQRKKGEKQWKFVNFCFYHKIAVFLAISSMIDASTKIQKNKYSKISFLFSFTVDCNGDWLRVASILQLDPAIDVRNSHRDRPESKNHRYTDRNDAPYQNTSAFHGEDTAVRRTLGKVNVI